MKRALLLCSLLFGAALAIPSRTLAFVDILVSSESTHSVMRYDGQTGAFKETFASGGGMFWPEGFGTGPDGHFYVSSYGTSQILRFNGTTGQFMDVFINAGTGGLANPVGLLWRDRKLYVGNRGTHSILRYDQNGAFLGTFAVGGGLSGPDDFVFGPDGDLYVSSRFNSMVLRYDGTSGAFKNVVASAAEGLNTPEALAFGPDRNLYVVSRGTNSILRFNGASGAPMGTFASTATMPIGLAFGPDQNLYVTSYPSSNIARFSGSNGAPLGDFVPSGSGGLGGPTFFRFVPGR